MKPSSDKVCDLHPIYFLTHDELDKEWIWEVFFWLLSSQDRDKTPFELQIPQNHTQIRPQDHKEYMLLNRDMT